MRTENKNKTLKKRKMRTLFWLRYGDTLCKKRSSDICKKCSSRSACTFAQPDLRATLSTDKSMKSYITEIVNSEIMIKGGNPQ